jgi:hypothetical protein
MLLKKYPLPILIIALNLLISLWTKFKTVIFFNGLKINKDGKIFLPKEINYYRHIEIHMY